MNEVCGKLNKVSEHELQRSVSHQSANSKSIEDVLFPLKISLDREKSVVEMKTIVGKGFYLHDLKHSLFPMPVFPLRHGGRAHKHGLRAYITVFTQSKL